MECRNKFDDIISVLRETYKDKYLNGILLMELISNTDYIRHIDEYIDPTGNFKLPFLSLIISSGYINVDFLQHVSVDEIIVPTNHIASYTIYATDKENVYPIHSYKYIASVIIFRLENGMLYSIDSNYNFRQLSEINIYDYIPIPKESITAIGIFGNVVPIIYHDINEYIRIFKIIDNLQTIKCSKLVELLEIFTNELAMNYERYNEILDEDMLSIIMDLVSRNTLETERRLSEFRFTNIENALMLESEMRYIRPHTLNDSAEKIIRFLEIITNSKTPHKLDYVRLSDLILKYILPYDILDRTIIVGIIIDHYISKVTSTDVYYKYVSSLKYQIAIQKETSSLHLSDVFIRLSNNISKYSENGTMSIEHILTSFVIYLLRRKIVISNYNIMASREYSDKLFSRIQEYPAKSEYEISGHDIFGNNYMKIYLNYEGIYDKYMANYFYFIRLGVHDIKQEVERAHKMIPSDIDYKYFKYLKAEMDKLRLKLNTLTEYYNDKDNSLHHYMEDINYSYDAKYNIYRYKLTVKIDATEKLYSTMKAEHDRIEQMIDQNIQIKRYDELLHNEQELEDELHSISNIPDAQIAIDIITNELIQIRTELDELRPIVTAEHHDTVTYKTIVLFMIDLIVVDLDEYDKLLNINYDITNRINSGDNTPNEVEFLNTKILHNETKMLIIMTEYKYYLKLLTKFYDPIITQQDVREEMELYVRTKVTDRLEKLNYLYHIEYVEPIKSEKMLRGDNHPLNIIIKNFMTTIDEELIYSSENILTKSQARIRVQNIISRFFIDDDRYYYRHTNIDDLMNRSSSEIKICLFAMELLHKYGSLINIQESFSDNDFGENESFGFIISVLYSKMLEISEINFLEFMDLLVDIKGLNNLNKYIQPLVWMSKEYLNYAVDIKYEEEYLFSFDKHYYDNFGNNFLMLYGEVIIKYVDGILTKILRSTIPFKYDDIFVAAISASIYEMTYFTEILTYINVSGYDIDNIVKIYYGVSDKYNPIELYELEYYPYYDEFGISESENFSSDYSGVEESDNNYSSYMYVSE